MMNIQSSSNQESSDGHDHSFSRKEQNKVRRKRRNDILKACMDITESIRNSFKEDESSKLTFDFLLEKSATPSPIPTHYEPSSWLANIPDTITDIAPTLNSVRQKDSELFTMRTQHKGFNNNSEEPTLPPFNNIPYIRPDSTMSVRTVLVKENGIEIAGGANGIFTRRLDFSSFNSLPKIKLNSYQIKTEDEGNHGNDDTRCFILSTLASHNRSKVQCVLCEEYLLVFDRYPLVDGTFFLSPRQHAKFCIEVKVEGRTQFLTCVCMGCLEGTSGRQVFCRYCNIRWDGSSLVLGTMYSYDIFAAMPCCTERIKCNSCIKPVLHPAQRLNYFSDYSHMVPCPHCRTLDTHFVKSLPFCFIQRPTRTFSQWP